MQGNKQNTFKSVVFGFAVLLAGQALTATVLFRACTNVDAEIRVARRARERHIALVGAFCLVHHIQHKKVSLASTGFTYFQSISREFHSADNAAFIACVSAV